MTSSRRCLKIVLCLFWMCSPTSSPAQDSFTGRTPAAVIRTSDLPLVAYGSVDGSLRVLDCHNPDCSVATTSSNLDSVLAFGESPPRIVLRDDTRPLIGYRGGIEQGLRVYDCADADCKDGSARPLDSVPARGINIAVRPDGRPLIVYGDADLAVRSVKVFDCDTIDCDSGTARIPAGQDGLTESGVSAVLRADGRAIVSNRALGVNGQNRMAVLDCADSGCTAGNTTYYGDVFRTQSVRRSDDTVFIGYVASGNVLGGFSCANEGCTSGSDTGALDVPVRFEFDVAIRDQDLPLFAYVRTLGSGRELRVFDCTDSNCSSGAVRTLDKTPDQNRIIEQPAVVIRADGTPLIAYHESSLDGQFLRFASCQDVGCESSVVYLARTDALFSDGFE